MRTWVQSPVTHTHMHTTPGRLIYIVRLCLIKNSFFFNLRGGFMLCCLDWPRMPGLKQPFCLNLLSTWDSRHMPSSPAILNFCCLVSVSLYSCIYYSEPALLLKREQADLESKPKVEKWDCSQNHSSLWNEPNLMLKVPVPACKLHFLGPLGV
jgi:hypothetical protein